jgi:GDSL-like Lipase/Acylhydrolase family
MRLKVSISLVLGLLASLLLAGNANSQATPVITWPTPAPVALGTVLGAAQLNATANVAGVFTYSPKAGTVMSTAGSTQLSATFTPTNTQNYKTATAVKYFLVLKATPVITWPTLAPVPLGTVLGPAQLNATANVAGVFTYSPKAGTVMSTAGSTQLSATVTPTNTQNYKTATAVKNLTVLKATPVITWAVPAPVPLGTVLGAMQLNATANVAGVFTYSPKAGTVMSTAGSTQLSATFTPTNTQNYKTATAVKYFLVLKATPVIMWPTLAPVALGTVLGPAQLNATANVAGVFTYSPKAGTVMSTAGSTQLSATFTPTNTQNYKTATAVKNLTVLKATPVITWAVPAPVPLGTVLGATQLNATANVAGVFTYSPKAGTVMGTAGSTQLSATFTPTDTQNYTTANAAVYVTVNPPPLLIQNLAPGYVIAGSNAQNLIINGANFLRTTTAAFAGVSHPIVYVNSTTLLFPLTASDQSAMAAPVITLTNPNGDSASAVLPIVLVPDGMLARSLLAPGDQSGLQRLVQKGRSGIPVTMVAIGGSITFQGSASDQAHNYKNVFQTSWNLMFPSSPATMINAGVGATNSEYGSVRTPRDVLAYNPDLVIVEFAVNDVNGSAAAGAARYGATYEGLVRQLLDAPSHPAVILLFMMSYQPPFVEDTVTAQPWQSAIGANYNVPMVSYYDAIAPELLSGEFTTAQIAATLVHPTDLGHAYAGMFLQYALQHTIDAFPPGATPDPIPATAAPLYSDHFEFTTLKDGIGDNGPALDPTNNVGWTAEPADSGQYFGNSPSGYQSSTPGSTLDFTVNGQDILISYFARTQGPMGQVSVAVDGIPSKNILDAYFISATNSAYRRVARVATGLAPGYHQVHIELLPTKDSGSTGTTFRLLAVGTGGAQ